MNRLVLCASIVSLIAMAPTIDACPRSSPCASAAAGRWPSSISLAGTWRYKPASLIGADAYRADLDDQSWAQMPIPSNWFLESLDRSGAVWFRRSFDTPPGAGRGTRLIFDGVDYAADVWLNGHYLGFHEGYFERFGFDIGAFLRQDGANLLAVRVDSPLEQGPSWSLHKRLIKGVFAHHDARPGNAWSDRGQEQNTGGIWGNVYLRPAGDVAIDGVRVVPSALASDGRALSDGATGRLAASVALVNHRATTATFTIRLSIAPLNFLPTALSRAVLTTAVDVPPGRTLVPISIDVPNVSRWWTWEHGHPNLYRATIELLHNGVPVDVIEQQLGFRTIAFVPDSGEWSLNGHRIFLRGTNYIGSQWLSEMTPGAHRRDLALMKQSGINAIRVHAHVEGDELYQQADDNGFLIWQDFPLQWGYVDDPDFTREAQRQAVAMVDQLGHHPSIATWSAHNEPPWDATWMKSKYADYSANQNRALDHALVDAIVSADATRHVHLASTTVEHPWYGWYSGKWSDYGKPATQSLITEFGAQALPGLASLRAFIPVAELWPTTDEGWRSWEYHDFQPRETFTLAGVPRGQSISELIDNTQRYQAQLVKFAAESYRRQKYSPVGGIFQFMFNECWPSANWGIVDYWRQPKAGFDALSLAYQPVLPSIAWNATGTPRSDAPVTAELWIVNDLWTRFDRASLEWTLRSSSRFVDTGLIDVSVPADSSQPVSRISKQLPSGQYELALWLRDSKGVLLGRNHWTFAVEDPQ